MPHYYADFRRVGTHWFRLDTRVYLDKGPHSQRNGVCVGAIVAKNPGSATGTGGWGVLHIGNDKMLPNVLSIFSKAYAHPIYKARTGKSAPPQDAYVQVLNLFYLCNPSLSAALKYIASYASTPPCPGASRSFPVAWYAWGGPSSTLHPFRTKFKVVTKHSFFFDPRKPFPTIKHGVPTPTDFAKHPQGLAHANIVPHLASVLP